MEITPPATHAEEDDTTKSRRKHNGDFYFSWLKSREGDDTIDEEEEEDDESERALLKKSKKILRNFLGKIFKKNVAKESFKTSEDKNKRILTAYPEERSPVEKNIPGLSTDRLQTAHQIDKIENSQDLAIPEIDQEENQTLLENATTVENEAVPINHNRSLDNAEVLHVHSPVESSRGSTTSDSLLERSVRIDHERVYGSNIRQRENSQPESIERIILRQDQEALAAMRRFDDMRRKERKQKSELAQLKNRSKNTENAQLKANEFAQQTQYELQQIQRQEQLYEEQLMRNEYSIAPKPFTKKEKVVAKQEIAPRIEISIDNTDELKPVNKSKAPEKSSLYPPEGNHNEQNYIKEKEVIDPITKEKVIPLEKIYEKRNEIKEKAFATSAAGASKSIYKVQAETYHNQTTDHENIQTAPDNVKQQQFRDTRLPNTYQKAIVSGVIAAIVLIASYIVIILLLRS